MEAEEPVRRMGIAALAARLDVSRTTVWRWCRTGVFPSPHYLGARRVWLVAEIEAWERDRAAALGNARPSQSNAERFTQRGRLQMPGRGKAE